MLASQVRYGQGQADAWQRYDLRTEEGVKQLLADRGYPDFCELVEEVRPKDAVLPLETHLFSTGWDVNLPPGESYAAIRDGYRDLARIKGESGTSSSPPRRRPLSTIFRRTPSWKRGWRS